jgi:polyhydroxyalkanoate synthesis regulator phasin
MDEYTRKLALLGIGIAALTREKAEEIVNEYVETGDISQDEGKKMVKDLMSSSTKHKTALENKIEEEVRKAAAKLNLASKDDIKRLEKKIAALEGKKEIKKKK